MCFATLYVCVCVCVCEREKPVACLVVHSLALALSLRCAAPVACRTEPTQRRVGRESRASERRGYVGRFMHQGLPACLAAPQYNT
jgi:hypothetical protein